MSTVTSMLLATVHGYSLNMQGSAIAKDSATTVTENYH